MRCEERSSGFLAKPDLCSEPDRTTPSNFVSCFTPQSLAHTLQIMYTSSALRLGIRTTAVSCKSTRYLSSTPAARAKNRIYPARIRRDEELQTLTLMSASNRVPLITLWTTTWCQSCKIVSPLVQELVEQDGVGEKQGGVSFVEVEMDSTDLGGLAGIGMRYGINSIPTLLAFDRQEPQLETKVSRLDDLKSKDFLVKWIETEASRHGQGGAGGRFFGLFGR